MEAEIREVMAGKPGHIARALVEAKGKHSDKDGLRAQIEALKAAWPTLQHKIREQIIPFEQVRQNLKLVGAPYEPEMIGVSRERFKKTVSYIPYMRNRFTNIDVIYRLGWMDEFLEKMFGEGGVWDTNKRLTPQQQEGLSKIKHVALDMDGTIYLGNTLFPFTKDFLAKMTDAGIGYSFLTNNPSKSIDDYLLKLKNLGIEANEENMYTTSLAAIDYIKAHYPQARKLFLLGTPSMISQFEKAGFISCADSPDDVPDVLVVAFDMTLEYSRLCRASWWASQGIPYIATNPDRVCPTDQKVVLVDCGSICKCIEHATGRCPDITLGKPDPNMLKGILDRHGLQPDEIAMVGDRIYTDTAMAHNAGAFGVLVLSGETTLETAEKVAEDARVNPAPEFFPPDLIVRDIEELGELLLNNRK
jgi:NagD protein